MYRLFRKKKNVFFAETLVLLFFNLLKIKEVKGFILQFFYTP